MESSLKSAVASTISNFKVFRESAKTVLGQITQFIIEMILQTAASLLIEYLKAKLLTKQYIALAAAKSAANPLSAPARAVAAASTAASVAGIVAGVMGSITFDDPVNDAMAYRSGIDYANQFLAGMNTKLGSGNFGENVAGMNPQGAGGGITINVSGNIYGVDDLSEIITAAIDNSRSRLSIDDRFYSGYTDTERI